MAQVLRGSAHLSLEQAEAANDFLGHSEEEGQYFLLLVSRERAGTEALRRRFEKQLGAIRESRLVLKNRLGVGQVLSFEAQATYYSAWYYGAIHALVSVPGHSSPERVAAGLGIEAKRAADVMSFLTEQGILRQEGGRYTLGTARIHLGNDSPLISKHHANWRMQALRSLERADARDDLHYSSVISISESDAARIREELVRKIEELKPVIRDSKEERVQCLALDFFRL